jgi:hypothetical protein
LIGKVASREPGESWTPVGTAPRTVTEEVKLGPVNVIGILARAAGTVLKVKKVERSDLLDGVMLVD